MLFHFVLIRICMAEEPPRGSYAIKYECVYLCVYVCMYVYCPNVKS